MTDKKEFEKTQLVSIEQLKGLINDEFGIQMKLSDLPNNHHVIMKILGPVKKIELPNTEPNTEPGSEQKFLYKVPCKIKLKGYEPFEILVQVGENAVKRLENKFPDQTYVGKYAFFVKTKYGNTYPQFINPMDNEPQEFKTKADIFKPISKDDGVEQEGDNQIPNLTPEESAIMHELLFNEKYLVWKTYSTESKFNFKEAYDKLADMIAKDKELTIPKLVGDRLDVCYAYFQTQIE